MIQRSLALGKVSATQASSRVRVFHDERIVQKRWLYHGYLIVPVGLVHQILASLQECRQTASCHGKRIHFAHLTAHSSTSTRTATAVRWTRYYRDELYRLGLFSILGIDLANVDWSRFGSSGDPRSEKEHRVYNRFFEMGLYGALRFFYPAEHLVIVEEIFSERRDLQDSDPFLHYAPYRIALRDTNIIITAPQVKLIAGDVARETTFPELVDCIQFVDIIIGSHSHNLDATAHSKTGCDEAADIVRPLTRRLTESPFNTNSRYWKRYSLSFFPAERVDASDFEMWPWRSLFYHDRPVRRQPRAQMPLF